MGNDAGNGLGLMKRWLLKYDDGGKEAYKLFTFQWQAQSFLRRKCRSDVAWVRSIDGRDGVYKVLVEFLVWYTGGFLYDLRKVKVDLKCLNLS